MVSYGAALLLLGQPIFHFIVKQVATVQKFLHGDGENCYAITGIAGTCGISFYDVFFNMLYFSVWTVKLIFFFLLLARQVLNLKKEIQQTYSQTHVVMIAVE